MLARKEQTLLEDNYKFFTYILNAKKLPTEHRITQNNDKEQRFKKKTPRDLGPEDVTVHRRDEGPTVQLCGDGKCGMQVDQWRILPGESTKRQLERFKRLCTHGGRGESPSLSRTLTVS